MSNILTAACNRATLARESAGRMLVDGRFVGIVLSLFTHTKKESPKMHPSVPILRFVSFRFVSDDRVFFATNVSSIFTTNHSTLRRVYTSIAARRLHGEELTKVAHEEHRADKHARASEEDHV